MKKIVVFCCVLLCYAVSLKGQESVGGKPGGNSWIWGPSIGYQYQHGNFLKLSGWGLFAPNEYQYIKINGGANFTWMMDRTTIVPELGLTYYLSDKGVWPFIKGEITPYTVTPKVGISLASLVDIGVGYGININQKSDFKKIDGFTFSVGFNLPLNFHLY